MDRPQKEKNLLLVEDDPDHVELALLALESHGLHRNVLVARDGTEALNYLLGEELPSFVLLDLKLPKVDGLEVLRRIRENERTRFLPVVVLSSSDEESDILRSYQLGVNSYILKAPDFEEFSEVARLVALYWVSLNHAPKEQAIRRRAH